MAIVSDPAPRAGALLLPGPPGGLMLPVLPGAACKGTDPRLWFPGSGWRSAVRAAKAVCAGCPVRERCLQWALDAGETEGIWGGATPEERGVIRKQRRRDAKR